MAASLSQSLGLHVEPIDSAMHRNVLYQPLRSGWTKGEDGARLLDPTRFELPAAEFAGENAVVLPHRLFLAPPERMELVVTALEKARAQAPLS